MTDCRCRCRCSDVRCVCGCLSFCAQGYRQAYGGEDPRVLMLEDVSERMKLNVDRDREQQLLKELGDASPDGKGIDPVSVPDD